MEIMIGLIVMVIKMNGLLHIMELLKMQLNQFVQKRENFLVLLMKEQKDKR